MSFTPEPQGRQANVLSILLFVLAAVCFFVPDLKFLPPFVFQTVGMLAVVAGIYILIRYKYIKFTYIVRPKGNADVTRAEIEAYAGVEDITTIPADMLDFVVIKAQGMRDGAMECLIGVENLADAMFFKDKKSMRELVKSKYQGVKLYDYSVSMFTEKICALIFRDGELFICAVIEPDDKFTGLINKIVNKSVY